MLLVYVCSIDRQPSLNLQPYMCIHAAMTGSVYMQHWQAASMNLQLNTACVYVLVDLSLLLLHTTATYAALTARPLSTCASNDSVCVCVCVSVCVCVWASICALVRAKPVNGYITSIYAAFWRPALNHPKKTNGWGQYLYYCTGKASSK
jgi:hypothetical protein